MRVFLPSVPAHPQFDSVFNLYKMDSDETVGSFNSLETFVVHSLYVRKKAEKQMYSTGEMVNYTIVYGNELAVTAENAFITDVLPDPKYMEYDRAEPRPTVENGTILIWNIGDIPPKGSGTIQLYAKIKENCSELNFKSISSVSGNGYVRLDQRLDTAQKVNKLTNYVNITAKYLGVPETNESSATVGLSDALGTAVKITGHGSGSYKREDETRLLAKNKSIQVKTSLSERYNPSSFSLPSGRSVNYNSKWSEAQTSNNRVTGAAFSERYMYADGIDRNSTLNLDKNGSTLASETSFKGAARIDVYKKSNVNDTPKAGLSFESHENYVGSFKVYTKVDEYGKNVVLGRSSFGVGMVSSDKRIGKSQRSHESGTGAYQAEEKIETQTNYISKELNVTYAPVRYAYTSDVQQSLLRNGMRACGPGQANWDQRARMGPSPRAS